MSLTSSVCRKKTKAHLKLPRVNTIVTFYERIPEIIDAKALEAFQRRKVEIQIVGVPGMPDRFNARAACGPHNQQQSGTGVAMERQLQS